MDKQILINEVYNKLYQMGIGCNQSMNSDMLIHCEFLDASFSTGKKTIIYDAEALFNETNQTIFLWEMTKEQGHGFSFGTDGESSLQSGKTLYRKVKSVRYGPDGKAYEYSLDLGAIPKAFKETANHYGWKFKTVINKEKARYSKDAVPMIQPGTFKVTPESWNNPSQNQAQPIQSQQAQYQQSQYQQPQYQQPQNQQAQYQQPQFQQPQYQQSQYQQSQNQQVQYQEPQQNPNWQPPHPKQKSSKGFPFWISLIPIIIITLALFLYADVTLSGYIIAGAFLLVILLLNSKIRKLGCIIRILLWLAIVIVLFFIFALNLPV